MTTSSPPTSPVTFSLNPQWRVRGPWSAGMREESFGPDPRFLEEIGGAYSVDPPSTKRVDAVVGDSGSHSVTISYPRNEIDWAGPRDMAGWAALQWQGLAWTELDVQGGGSDSESIILSIDVRSAIEFALVPRDKARTPAYFEWHLANYYSYDGEHTAHLLALDAREYWLVVRPLYEVRVFGGFPANGTPSITFEARISIPQPSCERRRLPTAITQGHLCVIPDVVEGKLASPYFSVGLRNVDAHKSWRIIDVKECYTGAPALRKLSLLQPDDTKPGSVASLAPLQTMKVGFRAEANRESSCWAEEAVARSSFAVQLRIILLDERGGRHAVRFELRLNCVREHDPQRTAPSLTSQPSLFSYKYTYLDHSNLGPHYCIVIPPKQWATLPCEEAAQQPVIVALHGAGVETDSPFWHTALRRQEKSWIVMPTGLTPWGLDWQQASLSTWQDLVADWSFADVLLPHNHTLNLPSSPPPPPHVVLVGHSNGGQGAWHGLVHGGDQVISGIVCAGYIKMEEYVAPTWRADRHTIDPALRGILDSARTVFANDVHASNVVAGGVPVTIKYGGEDDNVPPWHSREMGSLLRSWGSRGGQGKEAWPKVIEVPGKGHWWDEMLREGDVQLAIDEACAQQPRERPQRFTLTCVVPSTTRARNGWRIAQTEIPGRLARLEVEYLDAAQTSCRVKSTSNVKQLQVDTTTLESIVIGGSTLCLAPPSSSSGGQPRLMRLNKIPYGPTSHRWQLLPDASASASAPPPPRLLSPITLLLDQPSHLLLIQPTGPATTPERRAAYLSVSRRWAHSLLTYTTIGAQLVDDVDVTAELWASASASCVYLGGHDENLCLQTGVEFVTHLGSGQIKIGDRTFSEPGVGLLYSIPHHQHHGGDGVGAAAAAAQDHGQQQRSLVLTGTDPEGIERAARLLPVRTGTAVPEWVVVGRDAHRFGGAGVLAAGWYDNEWGWSEAMSYLG